MLIPLPTIESLILISILINISLCLFCLGMFLKLHKIEKDTHGSSRDVHKINTKIAKKVEDEAAKRIEEMIRKTTENVQSQIRVELDKLVDVAQKEASNLSEFVKNEQSAVLKESQLMVANIVNKAERDAEDYRKAQIDKLSTQVNSIVASAAREILGRSISTDEHENLVSQALEKAKKNKFFS